MKNDKPLMIFSGNSNMQLAKKVASHLKLSVGKAAVTTFSDGEISVEIQENNSIMFRNLSGSKLGIWSAHGEGKFKLPYDENKYSIIGKYGYNSYPANPNGSDYNTAIISSSNGRHIAMMPHLERSTFPWTWPYYPKSRKDEVSPWI